jgi:hypothetical protein
MAAWNVEGDKLPRPKRGSKCCLTDGAAAAANVVRGRFVQKPAGFGSDPVAMNFESATKWRE